MRPALRALTRAPLPRAAALRAASVATFPARAFHAAVPARASLEEDFLAYSKAMPGVPKRPSNEELLQLYALFKQGSVGSVKASGAAKPGMFDVVAKYKYNAWAELGEMPKEEAQKKYIELAKSLGAVLGGAAPAAPAAAAPPPEAAPGLTVTDKGGVRTLTLNRPDKRNAITLDMYKDLVAQFKAAADDPGVNILVVTGAGQFYCSGNDLSNFTQMATSGGGLEAVAAMGKGVLQSYVDAWISFPKPLVAAINGPAVGIAVTTLPLADLVYASHKATFHAPLAALGQTPEGTSSATFAPLMGHPKAFEFLVMGKKISAAEAANLGLVNDVFEDGDFAAKVGERVAALAALPPQAVRMSKAILRGKSLPALKEANAAECELIAGRWLSEECFNAVMAFLKRSK